MTIRRRLFGIVLALWVGWIVVGIVLSGLVVHASYEKGWPFLAAGLACCAAVGLCFWVLLWGVERLRRPQEAIGAFAPVVLVCLGLTPAVVRALLPWEEPGTGIGSPLATLMTIVFAAVTSGGMGGLLGGLTIAAALNAGGPGAETTEADH